LVFRTRLLRPVTFWTSGGQTAATVVSLSAYDMCF